jgi:predicted solute-binding protein
MEKRCCRVHWKRIEISFVPVFKIVHDDTIPVYSNFGISVDKKTGRVSVDNTWTSDGSQLHPRSVHLG